ncbi:MAG: hypothetical protein QME60_09290, partial [Verrucomicrobiota bacterium]|nr:hypothetical protein [Verrucomicrobiota bacterium]
TIRGDYAISAFTGKSGLDRETVKAEIPQAFLVELGKEQAAQNLAVSVIQLLGGCDHELS